MKQHTPEKINALMKPFEVWAMPDGYAEWYYKDKLTPPEEIAKIANELYRDFCIATVGKRPLTAKEIEIGMQLEADLNELHTCSISPDNPVCLFCGAVWSLRGTEIRVQLKSNHDLTFGTGE